MGISGVWGKRMVLGIVPPREAYSRGMPATLKAIELDSTLVEVHGTLANKRAWSDWDWDGAETEFLRAIQLNPSLAEVRVFYSHFLTAMGRPDEAAPHIERALELDPHNPFFHVMYGLQLQFARRYDDAIVQLQRALSMAPNNPLPHAGLWGTLHKMGRYEEALAEAEAFFAALGDREVVGALERGSTEAGYRGAMLRAAEVLEARSRVTFVKPMNVARLYRYAGEKDRFFEWLERAFVERDHDMAYLSVVPVSDSLRNDPRFQDLLRRMNLPQ